ncbi:MAG: hypothetical protein PWR13_1344 [Archaeoglobi archaeon]|nr:hypothetical protein [Candidatus Mnemosynella bozhongmuii]MDK2782316.1 hypothetical protein [Archaeoglobi archaeon]
MKLQRWQISLGIYLLIISFALYVLHYIIFRDIHHILIYALGDLAFLPIEVLLVTLIVHEMLRERERSAVLEKLNMVIGVFFSTLGTELLRYISSADRNLDEIDEMLHIDESWDDLDFSRTLRRLKDYRGDVDIRRLNLRDLREFLSQKMDFLIRLLENPVLIEHESFTQMLQTIFHLAEELNGRESFEDLPESDMEHLKTDTERAYNLLIIEWVEYMQHIQKNYPYLFSLAMRRNPFREDASIIIRG